MPGGDVEIEIAAPPRDLPWRWGEEEPIEGLRRREREELLTAFRQAREAGGAAAPEVDADGWAAEEMLEFQQAKGGSLVDWMAEDVAQFLLLHYPMHGTTTGAEVEELPRRFDAFLAWLQASGRGAAGRLAPARAVLVEQRAAFLAAASDERRYGPAKLMSAQMQAEGVDIGDQEAVAAFVERFNERLANDPTLLPMLGGPRTRWVWDGKGAAATASAACAGNGASPARRTSRGPAPHLSRHRVEWGRDAWPLCAVELDPLVAEAGDHLELATQRFDVAAESREA